jgi:hypothetical protein
MFVKARLVLVTFFTACQHWQAVFFGVPMKFLVKKAVVLSLSMWSFVAAAEPTIFIGADLKLGAQLIAEHQCSACHTRRVGGDGSGIYKPMGRINTPAFLRGMVEQCNTELNLGMFPEEVTAVAAVLNRDHYKFK